MGTEDTSKLPFTPRRNFKHASKRMFSIRNQKLLRMKLIGFAVFASNSINKITEEKA
jgi:hypothetical protein